MALTASLAAVSAQAAAPSTFHDVDGHWAENIIVDWQKKDLIHGYTDGSFKPNNQISRAEFITIMNGALGFHQSGEVSFQDVTTGSWYYNAVAAAVAQGYCTGFSDNTFRADATITRRRGCRNAYFPPQTAAQ